MFRFVLHSALAAGALASVSLAATPVSSVASYTAGSGIVGYTNPLTAVGFPDPLTGEGFGFPNILSPFSPPFESDEIVGIGAGGQITLRFDQPLQIGDGLEFGVFTNVGLQDANYPMGTNTSPATTFDAAPRVADVEISLDGVNFVPVTRRTFDVPTNYFSDAPNPYLTNVAGLSMADFGANFAFGLNEFSGRTWDDCLALFHGTAGGNWINVDSVIPQLGGDRFQFVRLSIPAGGIAGSDNRLFIDAVFANDNALIPEPAGLLVAAALAVLNGARRR